MGKATQDSSAEPTPTTQNGERITDNAPRWALLLGLLALTTAAHAHPADTSQLRVRLQPHEVSLRFTLNLACIDRLAALDLDQDAAVSPAELHAALPVAVAFLREKTLVTLNGEDLPMPALSKSERIWPNDRTEVVPISEMATRRVDLHFAIASPKTVVSELWLGFDIFAQFGEPHAIEAVYEQAHEAPQPVSFTQFEPEYTFDTGWADADFPAPAVEEVVKLEASPDYRWRWLCAVVAVSVLMLVCLTRNRGRSSER